MEQLAEHRDRVIEQLSSGFAVDRLEVEEYERRVALAHDAQTPAALDALVTDLVPATRATSLAAPSTALVPAKRLRVMFGSIERTGVWSVPSHMQARVRFGNITLDLREAELAAVTTIDANVMFGNLEVIVPPGVQVDMDAAPILGNVEDRSEPGLAATHLVRIVGRVRFGNVEAWTMNRGETKREARWRKRRERHERRLEHMLEMQRRWDRHAEERRARRMLRA